MGNCYFSLLITSLFGLESLILYNLMKPWNKHRTNSLLLKDDVGQPK